MEAALPKCQGSRMKPVRLSSLYLAPAGYYAALFHAERAQVEWFDHYRKQSYRNRCVIAGANGPLTLSIPVEKPSQLKCPAKDIRIAEHGAWRHLHWNAIVSAYRSTPFFPYYEDDFRPFYEKKIRYLYDFNEQLRELICHLIGIETPVSHTTQFQAGTTGRIIDLRETFDPKSPPHDETPPYYQVFAHKHGFISHLSIIDLLFNMGNESRVYFINHPSLANMTHE